MFFPTSSCYHSWKNTEMSVPAHILLLKHKQNNGAMSKVKDENLTAVQGCEN